MRQVARDKLISLGACIGKFTHSNKFRLGIGALDILSDYAKYKVRLSFGIHLIPRKFLRVRRPC